MKTLYTTLTSILLFSLLSPSFVLAELVDKVVAVVNDEVVTLSEVEEEARKMHSAFSKESFGGKPAPTLAEAREITLNNMIDRRIISQRAKATNTTVSEEEVDNAFESTRSRMGLEQNEFKKKLERSGMTVESYKKQLREQVLQSKLVSQDVRAKVVVTEEMLLDYYKEHYTAKSEKGSFYLLQMGFMWNQEIKDPAKLNEEKEETQKRAARTRDLVRNGQDFKATAKKLSDLPSASDGGDLGILNLDDMAPVMRKTVATLKPGELSEIVETPEGFQFFKILSGTEAVSSTSAFDTVKEEIRNKLYEEKLKVAYAEWVNKLRENAYIQKL